jgi:enediyne biosynthesis protein E4
MSYHHHSQGFSFSGWKMATCFSFMLLFASSLGAQRNKEKPLFTLMTQKQTGVSFLNQIEEDDSLNVFRYEYLYNGAGVGIGDFNNDGLNDIFFSGNTSSNKLFINKTGLPAGQAGLPTGQAGFQFTDVTSAAMVGGNGGWATGVSIADVNGDGLLDIYVCHSGKYNDPGKLSNELFINQGIKNSIPVFKEMAKVYGLDAPGTQSTQAAFFDYDKDGDMDMFLLNHSNHTYNPFLNTKKIRSTPDFHFGNRLFRCDRTSGDDIKYTDVTLRAGIVNNALNFGLSVTISDVNKDGWPDIYTTSDYTERDCFYLNNHDGTFTDVLEKTITHISKYAMGADIADYNNDGKPDIYTLDMLPEDNHRQKLLKGPDEYDQYHLLLDSGYYHQQMRNMLQLNGGMDDKGTIRFSEVGQLAGISNTDWSWAGLFADFDNDGWKDLFVTNGYLRDYTDMDFLKYTAADAQKEALKNGHLNYKTYDLVKKMPSNKLSNYIFRNNHDLTFSNTSEAWGFRKAAVSNAAAYADLDNDGDLDLVVCNNNEPALVYRNNQNDLYASHYLKLRFEDNGMNTRGYGVKVNLLSADGLEQYQELYPVRGYQSTVAPELVFGIPENQRIKKLSVYWPDGKSQTIENLDPDQTLAIKKSDAVAIQPANVSANQRVFKEITDAGGIDFVHRENDFVDFKAEVLLPYQLSREGPALAKADVDKDGREDIFLGGAVGQSALLYLQITDGKFVVSPSQPWIPDSACEDVNAVFFDADIDGDMDLYVVSGGNEYDDGSPEYNDRLYTNDGKGNFQKQNNVLPNMASSKKAIAAGDFDNDGDADLFVGGRGAPGSFPYSSRSYVLRNDSKNGKIFFTDVTNEVAPDLMKPGMVTTAAWEDLDKDRFPELFIAGDWMSVLLFKNDAGKLVNVSGRAGLTGLEGMWSALKAADVDNDGDIDFVAGNCGYNNQFKASGKEPMSLYANDFDDNGTVDPILCYFIQGKSYPVASRDELLDQIVPLRKKYIKYRDYADETINDIFPADKIRSATIYRCNELASGILYNDGNMHFSFKALPVQAQFSRIYGIEINDFDKDGITDILVAGNFFPYRVQLGRSDASLGLFLKGSGNKNFLPIDPSESGCYVGGDVRSMAAAKDKAGNSWLIFGKNDDAVQVLKINK